MHATAIYFYIFSSLLCHFLFIFHSYIGKLLFTAGLNKRFAAVAIFIIKLVIFKDEERREIKMKFLIFMTSLSVLMVIKSANSMMVRKRGIKISINYALTMRNFYCRLEI